MKVMEQKRALRKCVRAKLKALDEKTVQSQSELVWKQLWELPQYQTAKSIGLFLSMPQGEINTDPALMHALQHGKTIYVPEVGKNFDHADMELVKVVVDDNSKNQQPTEQIFHHNWPRNKWNIPEPPPEMPRIPAQPGDLDILVVPGLAFDHSANRLGQGKGYYDRFIARMMTTNKELSVFLVAVALQAQLVDETIPMSEHDQHVDILLLPTQKIAVKKKL